MIFNLMYKSLDKDLEKAVIETEDGDIITLTFIDPIEEEEDEEENKPLDNSTSSMVQLTTVACCERKILKNIRITIQPSGSDLICATFILTPDEMDNVIKLFGKMNDLTTHKITTYNKRSLEETDKGKGENK